MPDQLQQPPSAGDEPGNEHVDSTAETNSAAPVSDQTSPDPALSPLSTLTRILLLIAGWLLILIGIAGLVLPGIQGIITIVAGAAVLSLASEIAYRVMHRALGPWPGIWSRIERLRAKVHGWLSRE